MAVLASVPITTGLLGLLGIHNPIYATVDLPANALLDTNLRFMSGLWLGLGLAVLWLLPQIERQTVLFRAAWGMIFLGGLGRLLSIAFVGLPPWPFLFFAAIEVLGAPVLLLWQNRIAIAE